MARHRKKSPDKAPNGALLAFPFDPSTWDKLTSSLGLAPQEARVVERLLRGMSDKQIARDMKIKEPTLRTYFSRVFRHVGVDGRLQLVLRVFAEARPRPGEECHED